MEFIDPQLLDWENPADASSQPSQAEFSFSDYLFSDNDMAYYPPYPDFQCSYPEEPLISMQPLFQPGFVFAGFPPEPTYTPPAFPSSQYGFGDRATQTYDRPFPPATPVYHRYALRSRKAKAAEKKSSAKTVKAEKKSRPRTAKTKPFLPDNPFTEPLSKLAVGLQNFREVDMDAFVRRGAEERVIKEKVSRPLNAFMLYRVAYAEAARALLQTKLSTYISSVVGASWRLEPQEVKDRFRQLSFAEKEYHAELFPRYSFIPGLPRRKFRSVDLIDDVDDADDSATDSI